MRNNWEEFEWEGEWGPDSDLWDEYRDLREQAGEDWHQDGTFYLTVEEFVENFQGLGVCMTEEWREVRLKGKFNRVVEKQDSDLDKVISRFFYEVDVKYDTRATIGIHQEDQHNLGHDRRPTYDHGFVIMKKI